MEIKEKAKLIVGSFLISLNSGANPLDNLDEHIKSLEEMITEALKQEREITILQMQSKQNQSKV